MREGARVADVAVRGGSAARPAEPAAGRAVSAAPATLRDGLFPRSPAGPWPRRHRRPLLLAGWVAAALVLLGRAGGPAAVDTLWAEDGRIFLQDAVARPFPGVLIEPYAGYLHVPARLAAAAAALLPLSLAGAALTLFAVAAVASLAVFVFVAAAGHVPNPALRLALAGLTVLAPVGQAEVYAATANVHWFLLPVAFWALVWNSPRARDAWLAAAVLLLTGLSDPFLVLLAPVALLRLLLLREQRRGTLVIVAGWAAGVAAALAGMALTGAQRDLPASAGPGRLVGWYLVHVAGGSLFGDRPVPSSPTVAALLATAAVLPYAALLVLALRARLRLPLVFAVTAAGTGVLLYLVPAGLSGVAAPRYALPPVLLLYAALAALADGLLRARRQGRPRTAASLPLVAVTGAVLAVAVALGLPTPERQAGPSWSGQVSAATAECRSGASSARLGLAPPGWFAVIPCTDLRMQAPRPEPSG